MSERVLSRPRRAGLKRQFLLLIIGIYLLTGTVALVLFGWGLRGVTRQLGEEFAAQYVLRQKDRILGPIQRELALALQLTDSPLLKRWARDEDNADLKAAALAELDSYRRHFADRSYFFIIDRSRHYYYNDAADAYRGKELSQILDPAQAHNQWYFATMAKVADFDLNVDYDVPLDVNKVWINVVIRDGAEKLGMAGTGLELDRFIKAVLQEDRQGVNTVLLDYDGTIKAHHNRAYMEFNAVAKPEAERSTLYRLLDMPEEQMVLRARLEALRAGQMPVAVLPLTVEGKPYLAAVAYLNEIRWFAVALVDIADVYSAWRFAPFAVLLVIALLALAAAVTVLLNRLVLGPLARLHHSTQALAAGDYQQLATVEAHNEIGDLTRAFNAMTLTVRRYTERLEQLVEERTQELQQAHRALADAHRQVLDSIQYAQLLQQAMLPQPEVLQRTLGDYFVIWKPRDLVGGDFYYCWVDERGWLLAVVDCTGHGVPGAFMTMTANAVLNHVASAICADDPARILSEVNLLLRATLHQDDRGEAFENGLDMGICWRAWSEPRLCFAGARFDLFQQDGAGMLTVMRGHGRSLGYRRSDPAWTFENHIVELQPGQTFYLTSDGFLDQAGGPKGYGFGRRRFQEVLRGCGAPSLAARRAALEQALADWQGDRPQRDDITVVGFRLDGDGMAVGAAGLEASAAAV